MHCQHCGAEVTRQSAGDHASLVKGTVAIRAGRVETTCKSCGRDTELPLRIVFDTSVLTRRRRHAP